MISAGLAPIFALFRPEGSSRRSPMGSFLHACSVPCGTASWRAHRRGRRGWWHAPSSGAIAYDIAPGSVAAYYPEANALAPLAYHDPQSGTPSYKSVPVRIVARAAGP